MLFSPASFKVDENKNSLKEAEVIALPRYCTSLNRWRTKLG